MKAPKLKIDWSEAPSWANYVAMDSDGTWFWYEKPPVANSIFFNIKEDGQKIERFEFDFWKSTLQKRPKRR